MTSSLTPESTGLLTIDLGALAENWRVLARRAGRAECAAVVKADAYGTGLDAAARTLAKAGAKTFFVATFDEAERLRTTLPDATIYLLNGLSPATAARLKANRVRPVLGSREEIEEWIAAGGADAALHVDTGMNRLGLSPEEARGIAADQNAQGWKPALLMSHLACADQPAHPLNAKQIAASAELRGLFSGIPVSLCNSAGLLAFPDAHFDLVRPGIALYGGRALATGENPMQPVVTLEARVLALREAPAGTTVGYGARLQLSRDTRLAIIAAGYADGIFRAAGSSDNRKGAEVIAAGRRCPVMGRISMDLLAIDVTDLAPGAIARGDLVTLLGGGITIDDLALPSRTIGYEVLTALGRRWQRRYLETS